jgi:hypothetical protein
MFVDGTCWCLWMRLFRKDGVMPAGLCLDYVMGRVMLIGATGACVGCLVVC